MVLIFCIPCYIKPIHMNSLLESCLCLSCFIELLDSVIIHDILVLCTLCKVNLETKDHLFLTWFISHQLEFPPRSQLKLAFQDNRNPLPIEGTLTHLLTHLHKWTHLPIVKAIKFFLFRSPKTLVVASLGKYR